MRHFSSLLLLLLAMPAAMAQDTTRVLFLGNSYTFFNDLPTILSELAASMGHVVVTAQNTPGGASLQGHLSNTTSQSLIEQGDWDYVVLQEQSQKASLPYDQVVADFFPAVEALVASIHLHNECAVPLLYMTWGRENGDAQNCEWWPPVCTYGGMQELLTERYLEAANNTQSWSAPVGMIWEDVLDLTSINLYNADGSHPSAAGSYLAASTMFVALFGENPQESEYSGPIGLGVSTTIDEAIWDVWQDQPNAWLQYDLLEVEFYSQTTPEGCNIQVSASPYVDSIWVSNSEFDFIMQDGDIASLNFAESVTLEAIIYSGCSEPIAFSETFYSGTSSMQEHETTEPDIYPNPATESIWVVNPTGEWSCFFLNDCQGVRVAEWTSNDAYVLDVSFIPAGLYFLETRVDGVSTGTQKVLIQR
ncbi:hypothetical protein N8891_05725 [Flavobacteriales bacterium]|nr:hypothetical protein [Crocinitomicaceae bacterium]MDA7743699.1 hypothetical protein [Flavobacteriales bacterium]